MLCLYYHWFTISSMSKGDTPRPINKRAFDKGFDLAFGKKSHPHKPKKGKNSYTRGCNQGISYNS